MDFFTSHIPLANNSEKIFFPAIADLCDNMKHCEIIIKNSPSGKINFKNTSFTLLLLQNFFRRGFNFRLRAAFASLPALLNIDIYRILFSSVFQAIKQFARITDRNVMISDRNIMIILRGGMITDSRVMITDRSVMITDKNVMITDRNVMITDNNEMSSPRGGACSPRDESI